MKTKDNEKYPAGVTAEKVQQWQQENKNGIARIDSEAGYAAYLRRPTRNDMREFTAKQGTVDPVTYTEIVLDALWLGGDDEIRNNDEVFFGVMGTVQQVLDLKAATLKKL